MIAARNFTTKDTKIMKFGKLLIRTVRVLRTTMLENLGGLREFAASQRPSDSDNLRQGTKAPSSERKTNILANDFRHYSPNFANLAPLREIIRVLLAAVTRLAFAVSKHSHNA